MSRPPSTTRLVVEVGAFLLLMAAGLGAIGMGVGWPELLIWCGLVATGCVIILRGHARRRDRWHTRTREPRS